MWPQRSAPWPVLAAALGPESVCMIDEGFLISPFNVLLQFLNSCFKIQCKLFRSTNFIFQALYLCNLMKQTIDISTQFQTFCQSNWSMLEVAKVYTIRLQRYRDQIFFLANIPQMVATQRQRCSLLITPIRFPAVEVLFLRNHCKKLSFLKIIYHS